MDVKIRRAEITDKDALIQLYRKFDDYLNSEIRIEQQIEEEQYSDYEASLNEDSTNSIEQDITFVATVNKTVVGYISGSIKNRQHKKYNKLGYIADLFVNEDHQHSGIGKKLLDVISTEFKDKNCKLLQLNCLKNNPIARTAYENWGFRADSIRYQKMI